jgi:hypothetical protein
MNDHVKPPLPPMSGDQRSLLRRAVATSPGWKSYRERNALSMDKMSNETLWNAAHELGIDAVTVINGEREHKPRPFDREACQKLRDRFWAVPVGAISAKEETLCTNVLRTIFDKQDGRATVKQYELVDRIVTKAEEAEAAKASGKATGAGNGAGAGTQPELPKAAPEAPKEAPRPFLKAGKTPAEQIAEILGSITPQIDEEAIGAIVDARIQAALANVPTVRIEVKTADTTQTVDGHHHPMFAELVQAAGSRMVSGVQPNIWLAGPTGSGKTHAAKMTAKALGVAWHYNGALSMPHELLGFIDAGGTYHRTPFREAYEHGGVYLFDEVDGSDNSALLALNAALANGVATFPDGQVERHKDCVIIATANTWGLGATADYVGRAKIDAAFLSRFPVRLPWDYDTALEVAISGNPGFARRVIDARERARRAGLKVVIDPRASQAGAALIAAGYTPDKAAERTYLANLNAEQRNTVEGTR